MQKNRSSKFPEILRFEILENLIGGTPHHLLQSYIFCIRFSQIFLFADNPIFWTPCSNEEEKLNCFIFGVDSAL